MPSTLPSTDDAARIADLEAELSSRSSELASVRAALAASQAELEARVAELKAIFGDLQVDALPTKCSPASRQSAADLSASEGLKEARQTAADLSASEGDPQLELTRRVTWSQPPSGTPPPLPCDSSEIEISTSETSRASEKQQSPTASDGQSPPPQQLPPLPLFPPEPISVFSERISLVRPRPTDAAPTAPEPPPRPSQDAGVPPSPPPRGSLMELLDGDGGGGGSGGDVGGDGGDGGDGGEGGGGDGGGGDGGGGEGGGGEGGGGEGGGGDGGGEGGGGEGGGDGGGGDGGGGEGGGDGAAQLSQSPAAQGRKFLPATLRRRISTGFLSQPPASSPHGADAKIFSLSAKPPRPPPTLSRGMSAFSGMFSNSGRQSSGSSLRSAQWEAPHGPTQNVFR